MYKRVLTLGLGAFVVMMITAPGLLFADEFNPCTAIDKILEFKTGLELSDKQQKKLTEINITIVKKMCEAKKQAEIRKTEIDDFTANWASMHGTAVNHIIKEYYDYLAEFKRLELEAIVRARAILSHEQLQKFSELSSIEAMMLMFHDQLAGAY